MISMKHTLVTAFLVLSCLGATVQAQDQPAPSLEELLKTQYKVTKAAFDSDGFKIIDPGTVVIVEKAGIMATAQGNPHLIAFKLPKVCDNTFKNGNLTVPKACATTTIGSHFLTTGEKLYITKLEVNQKSNKIAFNLVECNSCNGVTTPSWMKTTVIFEFPSKFLDTAEPGQVIDVINQVFQTQKAGN